MSNKLVRLHALVYGRVQGVNFRFYTQKEAAALQVTGWVANRPEGSVEVMAEGEEAALKKLLAFLNRGPSSARVERVETDWTEGTGEFDRFRVRYFH